MRDGDAPLGSQTHAAHGLPKQQNRNGKHCRSQREYKGPLAGPRDRNVTTQVVNIVSETSCISSLIVCEHSHDNLEFGVVPALEPAMLSHSYSLAKPLSSRCVAC